MYMHSYAKLDMDLLNSLRVFSRTDYFFLTQGITHLTSSRLIREGLGETCRFAKGPGSMRGDKE